MRQENIRCANFLLLIFHGLLYARLSTMAFTEQINSHSLISSRQPCGHSLSLRVYPVKISWSTGSHTINGHCFQAYLSTCGKEDERLTGICLIGSSDRRSPLIVCIFWYFIFYFLFSIPFPISSFCFHSSTIEWEQKRWEKQKIENNQNISLDSLSDFIFLTFSTFSPTDTTRLTAEMIRRMC